MSRNSLTSTDEGSEGERSQGMGRGERGEGWGGLCLDIRGSSLGQFRDYVLPWRLHFCLFCSQCLTSLYSTFQQGLVVCMCVCVWGGGGGSVIHKALGDHWTSYHPSVSVRGCGL